MSDIIFHVEIIKQYLSGYLEFCNVQWKSKPCINRSPTMCVTDVVDGTATLKQYLLSGPDNTFLTKAGFHL